MQLDDGRVMAMAPTPAVGELDFDAFFRLEYPHLVVLAAALTGHRAVAEELAQEAMWRACARWSRISRYERPGAWVRRVAINLALSHRARRSSEERSLERLGRQRPPSPSPGADGEFWALVRRLPKRQAAAVTLHYLEDRSVADVAAVLGCSESTAKVHLHRGRAALAHLLDHREHD
ncbi:MAG: SigE family RNA polymerase sigma factor [Ilumatobacteraceae bacterium]